MVLADPVVAVQFGGTGLVIIRKVEISNIWNIDFVNTSIIEYSLMFSKMFECTEWDYERGMMSYLDK